MNIKRNIIFALESRKKDGVLIVENVPIRMRVNFASQRIEFTTGYRIDVTKWDADKQRVKNGCTNKLKQSASEINAALLGYYTEIQEIFKRFEVAEVMPSPADVKNAFNARHRSDDVQEEQTSEKLDASAEFYKAFDEFVRVCGRQNDWTHATYEKFAAVKNHLRSFRAELSFSFFNESDLTEYVRYLREVREMRNSTIGKQLSFLKWFLRWSFSQGMHGNNAYDTFRPKLKDTQKKIIFLTWEELTRLREFEIPPAKQSLDRVRDVFLFQCFTGLRYSDVYNLRRSDIKEDHIEVTTIKTSDSLVIELNKHSKAILEKYQDVVFEHDNKTIGLLLCNGGDKIVAQYALSGYDQPTGVSDYQPTKAIPDNLKSTQPQWRKLKEVKKELSKITINTK